MSMAIARAKSRSKNYIYFYHPLDCNSCVLCVCACAKHNKIKYITKFIMCILCRLRTHVMNSFFHKENYILLFEKKVNVFEIYNSSLKISYKSFEDYFLLKSFIKRITDLNIFIVEKRKRLWLKLKDIYLGSWYMVYFLNEIVIISERNDIEQCQEKWKIQLTFHVQK